MISFVGVWDWRGRNSFSKLCCLPGGYACPLLHERDLDSSIIFERGNHRLENLAFNVWIANTRVGLLIWRKVLESPPNRCSALPTNLWFWIFLNARVVIARCDDSRLGKQKSCSSTEIIGGIPDAAGLAAYVAPKLVPTCDYCFGIRQGVCRRITVISASDCWPI